MTEADIILYPPICRPHHSTMTIRLIFMHLFVIITISYLFFLSYVQPFDFFPVVSTAILSSRKYHRRSWYDTLLFTYLHADWSFILLFPHGLSYLFPSFLFPYYLSLCLHQVQQSLYRGWCFSGHHSIKGLLWAVSKMVVCVDE